MNDAIFSNSFHFNTISFDEFHLTDNRGGITTHYFAYLLSGSCKIVTDEETVEIKENEFFYLPCKCRYRSYWYGNPTVKFISLGFVYLPNFENKSYPVQVIPFKKEAAELFAEIAGLPLGAYSVGKFYNLAAMLLPLMKDVKPCRTREIVNQTRKYLFTHPFASATEMAKNCAISEAALYSAFQKASDITPNELKCRLLLEKAKELLISTDKSVEDISETLNFSSSSYFRKKFKNYFEITPTEMRKKYRI